MKKYLAEFLATFFLVFAVAGAAVADHQLAVVQVRDSFGPLGVALAYGLAYAAAIAAVAAISGGYANPAVSLAMFVTGRLNAKDLLGYIGAQLAGGLAGAVLIRRLFVAQADQTGVGAPALGEGLTMFQGIAIEILLTFFLVLVIWGVAVDRKGAKSFAPLTIGLTLTTMTLIGAAFTGAAMNPARWLGSAIAAGQFDDWPVWIVGPSVGALLAALLYESVLLTDEPGIDVDEGIEDEMEDTGRPSMAAASAPGAAGPEQAVAGAGPPDKPAAASIPAAAAVPGASSAQSAVPAAPEPALESSPPPPPPPPGPAPAIPPAPIPPASPIDQEGGQAQKAPEQMPAPGPESSQGDGT